MDTTIYIFAFFIAINAGVVLIYVIYLLFLKIIKWNVLFSELIKSTFKSKTTPVVIVLISFLLILISYNYFFEIPLGSAAPLRHNYDGLVKGKFGYKIPDTMKVGNQYKAIVTVTKGLYDTILFLNLDSAKFTKVEIKISSKAKVILLDPTDNKNFSITALNTEEQLIDTTSNTIWIWNIIPLQSGENELILRATVESITNLGEASKDIPVFEKIITVQSSPLKTFQQFFKDNWQWIAGTILIPLLIWIISKMKNKKDEKKLTEIKRV